MVPLTARLPARTAIHPGSVQRSRSGAHLPAGREMAEQKTRGPETPGHEGRGHTPVPGQQPPSAKAQGVDLSGFAGQQAKSRKIDQSVLI